jgi:hypothetical protein
LGGASCAGGGPEDGPDGRPGAGPGIVGGGCGGVLVIESSFLP